VHVPPTGAAPCHVAQRENAMKVARDAHAAEVAAATERRKWEVQPFTSTGKVDTAKVAVLQRVMRSRAMLKAGKAVTLGHGATLPALAGGRSQPQQSGLLLLDDEDVSGVVPHTATMLSGSVLHLTGSEPPNGPSATLHRLKAELSRAQLAAHSELDTTIALFLADFDRKYGNRLAISDDAAAVTRPATATRPHPGPAGNMTAVATAPAAGSELVVRPHARPNQTIRAAPDMSAEPEGRPLADDPTTVGGLMRYQQHLAGGRLLADEAAPPLSGVHARTRRNIVHLATHLAPTRFSAPEVIDEDAGDGAGATAATAPPGGPAASAAVARVETAQVSAHRPAGAAAGAAARPHAIQGRDAGGPPSSIVPHRSAPSMGEERWAETAADLAGFESTLSRVNRLIDATHAVNTQAKQLQYGAMLKPVMEGVTRTMTNLMAADATAGAVYQAAEAQRERDDIVAAHLEEVRHARAAAKARGDAWVQPAPWATRSTLTLGAGAMARGGGVIEASASAARAATPPAEEDAAEGLTGSVGVRAATGPRTDDMPEVEDWWDGLTTTSDEAAVLASNARKAAMIASVGAPRERESFAAHVRPPSTWLTASIIRQPTPSNPAFAAGRPDSAHQRFWSHYRARAAARALTASRQAAHRKAAVAADAARTLQLLRAARTDAAARRAQPRGRSAGGSASAVVDWDGGDGEPAEGGGMGETLRLTLADATAAVRPSWAAPNPGIPWALLEGLEMERRAVEGRGAV